MTRSTLTLTLSSNFTQTLRLLPPLTGDHFTVYLSFAKMWALPKLAACRKEEVAYLRAAALITRAIFFAGPGREG
jgi:hypothetical protein